MRSDGMGKLEMGNPPVPDPPSLCHGPAPSTLDPGYAPCSPSVASHPLRPQCKGLNTCLILEGSGDHKAGTV